MLFLTCIALECSAQGFIQNKGQVTDQHFSPNNTALFVFSNKNFKVILTERGFSYEIAKSIQHEKTVYHRIDFKFLNTNPYPTIIAEDELPETLNYFTAGCGSGIVNVKLFSKIIYRNIYSGIDAEFLIDEKNNFKYNFIVRPHADLSQLKIFCEGANAVSLANGDIKIETSLGNIFEKIPLSYLSDGKIKQPAVVKYYLEDKIISFVSDHDQTKTLIIDPFPNLKWATYYGDLGSDFSYGIAADAFDNVIVTGYTSSASNIATTGSFQDTLNGVYDVFVVKFNPAGVRQWATYFGGPNLDRSSGVVLDSTGNIYITGSTFSTVNFATAGSHQSTYGGGIDDAFLAKFSSAGVLTWATYFGGTEHDFAQGICIKNGFVSIAGHTESTNAMATPSAYQNFLNGVFDGFAAKFDLDGVLQWSTYYGGAGLDECASVTSDNAGNIFITGFTQSTSDIATTTAHQPSFGGGANDAFLAKLNSSGSSLLWGTYYGGTNADDGYSINCDASGNIYLAGTTASTNAISTPLSFQPAMGSANDAYLAKFTPSGSRIWGTYFGGNDVDYIFSLVADKSQLFFAGMTQSSNNIASTGAYHETIIGTGVYDAFLAKFDTSGARNWGTYFGGSNSDEFHSVYLDSKKNILVSGFTSSPDSISTSGSHQPVFSSGNDAFIARFCQPPVPLITANGPVSYCEGDSVILTADSGYVSYLWSDSTTGVSTFVPSAATAGTYTYFVTATDSNNCSGVSASVSVVVNICQSVNDESEKLSLNVFPNPVQSELNILVFTSVSGQELSIELFSADGKKVFSAKDNLKNNSSLKKIDVSRFAPGLYEIKIISGKISESSKIVIE